MIDPQMLVITALETAGICGLAVLFMKARPLSNRPPAKSSLSLPGQKARRELLSYGSHPTVDGKLYVIFKEGALIRKMCVDPPPPGVSTESYLLGL